MLHTGDVPPHCALDTHGTQVPLVVKQAGVAPEHAPALVAEHCPHAPLGWHAGVDPPHSPSPPQARQRCVPPSHTGVEPPQSALATQRTHVPVGAKQTGVAPPQASEFDVEHWPHAPLVWQAGVAPPHSPSAPQPRHISSARSHTGVAPPQSELARQPTQALVAVLHTGTAPPQWLFARHCTHVAFDVSQIGVDPPHNPGFAAEQAPHAPLVWHTGAVPGHSASAPQLRQLFVARSQIGVVLPQLAFDTQATQRRGETPVRHSGVAPLQSLLCVHCSTNTVVVCAPAWAASLSDR